ncbi:MAG: hypothetical protein RL417_1747 [Pseudomonadota bacterium]|jgi:hypothetical protein
MTASSNDNDRALWEKLHTEACARRELTYRDPRTGYTVFTRVKLLERGYCCKSGCRHCPYGCPDPVSK